MNLFIAYPANDKTFESFQEEYSGDSEASGRETHLSERASHRGHGGHRGGFLGAMVRAGFRWTSSLLGGKHAHRGEHRTEVTEVTEEDFWGRWCERALGWTSRFSRETHASGRASHRGHRGHRGGFWRAMVRAGFWWTSSLLGGKHTFRGKSIAQRSRRSQRRILEGDGASGL
jgi:hypothetical protein